MQREFSRVVDKAKNNKLARNESGSLENRTEEPKQMWSVPYHNRSCRSVDETTQKFVGEAE